MSSTGPLNNSKLNEEVLKGSEYNSWPTYAETSGRICSLAHCEAYAALRKLIDDQDLSHIFSITLMHKHLADFDLTDGQIVVCEPKDGDCYMWPRDPATVPDYRGLHFRAHEGGFMKAYEFTTLPATDLSAYEDFVAEFNSLLLSLEVGYIFALSVKADETTKGRIYVPSHRKTCPHCVDPETESALSHYHEACQRLSELSLPPRRCSAAGGGCCYEQQQDEDASKN